MKSDRQIESSTSARRAILFRKISAVIDQMPEKFQATELYEAAGIENHKQPQHRMLISSILQQDFRLLQITKPGGKRFWMKPKGQT